MATVPENGTNPGRAGRPMRQSPGRLRSGRAEGGDVTEQPGQYPSDIFGFRVPDSTGAGGTAGSSTSPGDDVTMMDGQLEQSFTGLSGSAVTSTGLPGSSGASNSSGGETIRYTDMFGFPGGVNREISTTGRISGEGDWTQANDMGYAGGPTLPVLQNARPTSTGAGQGRVSTHRKG